ncbi:hypothetical protein ACS0TY_014603 [Phlomoides rotata]
MGRQHPMSSSSPSTALSKAADYLKMKAWLNHKQRVAFFHQRELSHCMPKGSTVHRSSAPSRHGDQLTPGCIPNTRSNNP